MKTTDEFLSELRHLDVKLWVDGDRLRYRASKETLASVLAQLRERKAEILTFLQTANTTSSTLPPILPAPRNDKLILSFAQQRLWFLEQFQPGSVYNIPVAYRLKGSLNMTALERSLGEVIRRHESLRTTFSSVDGEPSQVIAPDITLPLTVIELQVPPDQLEAEAQRKAIEEAQQPLDLAQGPLLRVKLLRLSEEEHVLLLTMHHIVSDGWSLKVFFREFTVLYEAFSADKPSPLPKLAIQYTDFAHWQRQWLQGEVLESQLDYWKQQLGGSIPVLHLPTDHPRPSIQSYQGRCEHLMLPKTLTDRLKALSQQSGTTLFMTLLAAFKILLYRYSGQEDIIVGSPAAGRSQVETEALIGFFVNALVLRTDLSGNPSFRELLGRVHKVSLGAYAHQNLPFEKLVEAIQPERDRSHSPLFQVMFALNPLWSVLDLPLPGLTIKPLFGYVHSGTSKFDLTLVMSDTDQGLMLMSFEYNTNLFEAATITRMLGHFQTLLEGIVANPEQPISDLPLLMAPERHQLLVKWNDTQTNYPSDACIHQLFEAQVERTPDAVAVVFDGQQLTYRELNVRANQLAHYLQILGVRPEVLVGICIERSIEMVVGLLGILKAGGAYLPLDLAYPLERKTFMLEDAQVTVLLTQECLLEKLPVCSAQVVCLDLDWKSITQESDANPANRTTADNLAYVIYTSGSTGKPKGVEIQHDGLVNLVTWHQHVYNLTPVDRAIQLAGPAFDASVWELWPYLTAGASIHIPDEATRMSPSKLWKWLAESATTICFLPTLLAEAMLEEQWPEDLALRAMLVGGDKLHRSPQKALPFGLVNHYGPTENTVVTTWAPVAAGSDNVAPPIGRPIANTQIYLLDSKLQLVPIGVPGELYIGGAGLARGYLNRPELTKEKFVSNPFSDELDARLYKTGDLGRYLPDGNIEFLGRIDNQVKIRGFRIEIGEIEALLIQHPNVWGIVVIDREDIPGEKRLVAYVVLNQRQTTTVEELRCFLKQKLPDYMVPSAFVLLEALPLTPNGKVDRRALPAPDQSRPDQSVTYVPPRTALEQQIADIWAQVLKLECVGIHDNFFGLGGHSLLTIQVISRLRQTLQVELPLRSLFELTTVVDLAEHIETVRWAVQELQSPANSTVCEREEIEL